MPVPKQSPNILVQHIIKVTGEWLVLSSVKEIKEGCISLCSNRNNFDRNAQLFNMFNNPSNVLGTSVTGDPIAPFSGVLSVPTQVQSVQTVVQDYAFTAIPITRPIPCEEKKKCCKPCCCQSCCCDD